MPGTSQEADPGVSGSLVNNQGLLWDTFLSFIIKIEMNVNDVPLSRRYFQFAFFSFQLLWVP